MPDLPIPIPMIFSKGSLSIISACLAEPRDAPQGVCHSVEPETGGRGMEDAKKVPLSSSSSSQASISAHQISNVNL